MFSEISVGSGFECEGFNFIKVDETSAWMGNVGGACFEWDQSLPVTLVDYKRGYPEAIEEAITTSIYYVDLVYSSYDPVTRDLNANLSEMYYDWACRLAESEFAKVPLAQVLQAPTKIYKVGQVISDAR